MKREDKICGSAKCYPYQYGTSPHIIITHLLTPIQSQIRREVEDLSETKHVLHSIDRSAEETMLTLGQWKHDL